MRRGETETGGRAGGREDRDLGDEGVGQGLESGEEPDQGLESGEGPDQGLESGGEEDRGQDSGGEEDRGQVLEKADID